MDIIVTIPKSEYENDVRETEDMLENDLVQFWTLSKCPKDIQVGDRVYFIKNQRIESSMRIIEIQKKSTTLCETTKREWSGDCQLFLDDLRYEDYPHKVKGFQGFRYFETFLSKLNQAAINN